MIGTVVVVESVGRDLESILVKKSLAGNMGLRRGNGVGVEFTGLGVVFGISLVKEPKKISDLRTLGIMVEI